MTASETPHNNMIAFGVEPPPSDPHSLAQCRSERRTPPREVLGWDNLVTTFHSSPEKREIYIYVQFRRAATQLAECLGIFKRMQS